MSEDNETNAVLKEVQSEPVAPIRKVRVAEEQTAPLPELQAQPTFAVKEDDIKWVPPAEREHSKIRSKVQLDVAKHRRRINYQKRKSDVVPPTTGRTWGVVRSIRKQFRGADNERGLMATVGDDYLTVGLATTAAVLGAMILINN